jgi:CrcB protein
MVIREMAPGELTAQDGWRALRKELTLGVLNGIAIGLLVGIAVALIDRHPGLPPEARLFAITGFLGGLTTFSTFSYETVVLAEQGMIGSAAANALASVVLCVLGAALGLALGRALAL